MDVEYPNASALTAAEEQELEKLKRAIAQASKDGIIDRQERDRINRIMLEDHHATHQEMALIRTLIQEKVAEGTLTLDYS